mmetsp:Transcript_19369/g.65834  ORF Transcript_19369/g.65834 Transcript_19369/m.65834 type:complete len:190 (-) Transcript_19369:2027-2596(-)
MSQNENTELQHALPKEIKHKHREAETETERSDVTWRRPAVFTYSRIDPPALLSNYEEDQPRRVLAFFASYNLAFKRGCMDDVLEFYETPFILHIGDTQELFSDQTTLRSRMQAIRSDLKHRRYICAKANAVHIIHYSPDFLVSDNSFERYYDLESKTLHRILYGVRIYGKPDSDIDAVGEYKINSLKCV